MGKGTKKFLAFFAKRNMYKSNIQCEEYEKFIATAERLLEVPKAKEPDFRDEIYCMLADGHYFSGDIATAVIWQERILKESKNKELIEYTKNLKRRWEQML